MGLRKESNRVDRRRTARLRKRLRVRLEPSGIRALTSDLSTGGLFIVCHRVLRPGTPVRVEIQFPDGTCVSTEGVVRRAKRLPGSVSSLVRGGMGIEFTKVPEKVREYLGQFDPPLANTG